MSDTQSELPERVDAEQARQLIAKGEVRVIDIRSAEEFAEERINGSKRVDPDELHGDAIADLVGRKAVLVICGDGSASADAAERLRSQGHEAASIEGGFDSWTSEKLPTAPGRDEEYKGPEVKLPGAVASSGGPDDDEEDSDEAEPDAEGRRGRESSETQDEERAERREAG